MEKEIKSTDVLLASDQSLSLEKRREIEKKEKLNKNKQDAERTQRTENKNPLRSASFTISENKKKKI